LGKSSIGPAYAELGRLNKLKRLGQGATYALTAPDIHIHLDEEVKE
jgi:hypothetical protein